MHRLLKTMLLASVASLISPLAGAQTVVDQSAATANSLMANFDQVGLAQSFQQNASTIAGAGVLMGGNISGSATLTISLWDHIPDGNGSALASGTVLGTTGQWANVYWSPVSIVANQTYYLDFNGGGIANIGIRGDIANGYARGMVFANHYHAFPTFDYTFRTFASVAGVVPEPSTYAMLVLGLGMLGFARIRRKG